MGPASRLPPPRSSGLHRPCPPASETGEVDRKGQPISKAGNRLLRTTLHRAADTARTLDPSWPASTGSRGSSEAKTTSLPCAWSPPTWPSGPGVMDRAMPDVICDTDGTPVTPTGQADHRAALHRTPEVRRRRRSRKGKPSASPRRTSHRRSDRTEATLPSRRPVLDHDPDPSSQPRHTLDNQTSIRNQPSWSTPSRARMTTDTTARAAARTRGAAWAGSGSPARMARSLARKRR
jgi:hypothetical protein